MFQIFNAWYNTNSYKPNMDMPEVRKSYALADKAIGDLIQSELDSGVPLHRIILGI